MKKLLSLFLALSLCLSCASSAFALDYGKEYAGYHPNETPQYSDVPFTHWAYPSIETCTQRTWFNGYPDGTFRPDGYIRRDEAAKVFAIALGLTLEENPTITYTDTADSWAKAHIEATKALFPNVANLQGTSSFRPSQTVTREETVYALLVAWRYASKTTNADLSVLNMFSDADSISEAVKPYMAVAVSEGLVSGLPNGTIAAQKGLTRAEFAALLARALSHGYGSDTTDIPTISISKYAAETTETCITVTGKISPVSTGTKLTLDGEAVTLSSSGAFQVTVNLELGENTFTLAAENAYSVRDSKVIQVTRLEMKPEPTQTPQTPQPSQDPKPTQDPQSTQDPQPTQKPQPTQVPQPTQDPQPSNGPSQDTSSGLEIDPDRDVTRTGKCGDNLYWVLYADGELVISGKGRMDFSGGVPWANFKEQITAVTVCDGILNIGKTAFQDHSKLTKVTLPDSLTSIDGWAFASTSLSRIMIPSSVTDIGEQAFYNSKLSRIVIPDGVTFISDYTFFQCSNLTSVTIPSSVTDIGTWAFQSCSSLSHIYYGGNAQQWAEIGIASNNHVLNSDSVTIHFNSSN